MTVWLLFIDLDGTIWDHPDVSTLKPPFHRLSEDTIRVSEGAEIHLNHEIVRLIEWARARGAVVSTLSWNKPSHALAALEAFGLTRLFDYHAIEPHSDKGEYAARIVEAVEREYGIRLKPCQIVYIDDRRIHLEGVRERLGPIIFLQAWKDFKSLEEAKEKIEKALCPSQPPL